jgi:hypothetical protein
MFVCFAFVFSVINLINLNQIGLLYFQFIVGNFKWVVGNFEWVVAL